MSQSAAKVHNSFQTTKKKIKKMQKNILNDILRDICIELSEEFDDNFTTGGFFGTAWKSKFDGSKSHLQQSGMHLIQFSRLFYVADWLWIGRIRYVYTTSFFHVENVFNVFNLKILISVLFL
jgi:hypothetical protein